MIKTRTKNSAGKIISEIVCVCDISNRTKGS